MRKMKEHEVCQWEAEGAWRADSPAASSHPRAAVISYTQTWLSGGLWENMKRMHIQDRSPCCSLLMSIVGGHG